MAIDKVKRRFYFGSAGDVQALPAQAAAAGTAPSPNRYGALTRALNGTPTVLSYGSRRVWNLTWPRMLHADTNLALLQRIEAVFRGYIMRRFYLLDTRNVNFLPADIASCGGDEGTQNFAVTSGTLSRVNNAVLHTDLNNLAEGYLSWNGATAGSGQNLTSGATVLPVVAGSAYKFSMYLSGTGSVKLGLFFSDANRGALSNVLGSTITLGAATRVTFDVPAASVPANGAIFLVGLQSVTTVTTLSTAGWQVQYDDATLANWEIGRGGAEVTVNDFTIAYPDPWSKVITASFLEV